MDFFSISSAKGKIKGHYEGIAKKEKQEKTYAKAVGALGYAVFGEDEKIPANDFFIPGKVCEIRAKHSNSPCKLSFE